LAADPRRQIAPRPARADTVVQQAILRVRCIPGASVLPEIRRIVAVDARVEIVDAGLVIDPSAGGRRDPDLLRKLLVPKLLTAVIDIEARQAAVLDIEGLASERADRRQRVSAAERPFELVRDTVLTRLLGSRLRVLED